MIIEAIIELLSIPLKLLFSLFNKNYEKHLVKKIDEVNDNLEKIYEFNKKW